jgi:hypothetical protein
MPVPPCDNIRLCHMARFAGFRLRQRQPVRGEAPIITAGIAVLLAAVLTCAGLLAVPLWTAFATKW